MFFFEEKITVCGIDFKVKKMYIVRKRHKVKGGNCNGEKETAFYL